MARAVPHSSPVLASAGFVPSLPADVFSYSANPSVAETRRKSLRQCAGRLEGGYPATDRRVATDKGWWGPRPAGAPEIDKKPAAPRLSRLTTSSGPY
jgi:hypothetical protein